MGIKDYNATAGDNTAINGIDIQGSAPPANFDNSQREILSDLKKMNDGTDVIHDTLTLADPTDETKRFRFDGVDITPGQTRIVTIPDEDGTLATESFVEGRVVFTSEDASAGDINHGSIPSWATKIDLAFAGVSTDGTAGFFIQLGDAGGLETSGYTGSSVFDTGSRNVFGSSFNLSSTNASANYNGILTLVKSAANTWSISGSLGRNDDANGTEFRGSKALSDTLTQIQISATSTDVLDAGTIGIRIS